MNCLCCLNLNEWCVNGNGVRVSCGIFKELSKQKNKPSKSREGSQWAARWSHHTSNTSTWISKCIKCIKFIKMHQNAPDTKHWAQHQTEARMSQIQEESLTALCAQDFPFKVTTKSSGSDFSQECEPACRAESFLVYRENQPKNVAEGSEGALLVGGNITLPKFPG